MLVKLFTSVILAQMYIVLDADDAAVRTGIFSSIVEHYIRSGHTDIAVAVAEATHCPTPMFLRHATTDSGSKSKTRKRGGSGSSAASSATRCGRVSSGFQKTAHA